LRTGKKQNFATQLNQFNLTIPATIEELQALVIELLERIDKLEKENRELKAENEELKFRLRSNSKNSSKPPSSDGYQRKPAFPRKSKGKKGGQAKHKGSTLHQVSTPDEEIKCLPDQCTCGHSFCGHEIELTEKRQVFDLPQPKLRITEYQIYKAKCPVCGKTNRGAAPEGVKAPVQYGNGVKSFIVILNVHYKIPYKKVRQLFNDLFGYPINESTIISASEKCFTELETTEEVIKSIISSGKVTHADETGLRIEGRLQWLHTASSNLFTYLFVHKKRGKEAIESEKSILPNLRGWLVHDAWSSYFGLNNYQHALCGAHILRELQGLMDLGQSKWAKTFKSFLMNVYEMPFAQRLKYKANIRSRYKLICELGEKIEPPPKKEPGKRGRPKRTKGRNLVERLIKYQDAVLAFAFNDEVPFTNNLAERDIRPTKIKQKVSNSFRSFKGAEYYARIEGFISTARKNNKNIFNEICSTFEGYNFITQLEAAK